MKTVEHSPVTCGFREGEPCSVCEYLGYVRPVEMRIEFLDSFMRLSRWRRVRYWWKRRRMDPVIRDALDQFDRDLQLFTLLGHVEDRLAWLDENAGA